jgi:hypothetical protein
MKRGNQTRTNVPERLQKLHFLLGNYQLALKHAIELGRVMGDVERA